MTDYSIETFLDEQERERQAQRGRVIEPPKEEDDAWLDVDDALLFAPRAAEGFVRSLGSLLPGLDFDDSRWFGRSDTFVGSALESIAQFGMAMIPGGGIARGLAGLAKAGKLGSTLKQAHGLSKTVGGLKGGRFLLAAGEGAGAGAIADFLAFDGHEQNLASVLNAVPQLQGVVPDWLAIDEDTGEYEGRIKNVLEGLGMGAAFGVLMEGLRGVKAGRKASEEVAGRPLNPDETREVMTSSADPGRLGEGLGEIEAARFGPSEQQIREMAEEDAEEAAEQAAREAEPAGDLDEFVPKRTVNKDIRRVIADGEEVEVNIAEPWNPLDKNSTPLSQQKGGREALYRELVEDSEEGDELWRAMIERRSMGDLSANPRKLEFDELLEQLITSKHHNIDTILADKDRGARWLVRALEDVGYVERLKGVTPDERNIMVEAYIKSYEAGLPMDVWLDKMIKRTREGRASIEKVMIHGEAFSRTNAAIGGSLAREVEQELANGVTEEGIARITKKARSFGEVTSELSGVKTAFGEGLASIKRWADYSDADAKFAEMLAGKAKQGSKHVEEFLNDFHAATSRGTSTAKSIKSRELAELTIARQVWNMTTELFVNNILGGFKTLAIQPISGTVLSIALPMEQMIGGFITGDSRAVKTAIREITGYMTAFSESARMAADAWRKGDTIIGGRGLTEGSQRRAWQAGALGTKQGTPMGDMLDTLGAVINLPSRLISSADEFTKQMRARSVLQADLYERALSSHIEEWVDGSTDGIPTKTLQQRPRTQAEIEDFVQSKMRELIVDGQLSAEVAAKKRAYADGQARGLTGEESLEKYVDENWQDFWDTADGNLVARAEESMKEVTLQTDIDYDRPEGKIDIALNSHPIFKLIVPFYKTPLNSIKFGAQRVDAIGGFQYFMSKVWPSNFKGLHEGHTRLMRELHGSGLQKAQATGRIMSGLSFTAMGMGLASQGILTGRGPSNPDERRTLLDAGWQPYSIKVGDKYVSYARLEPFSQFFGFMADLTDAARLAGEDDNVGLQDVMAAFLVPVANNVTQKSFLSGIGAFINAMSDPTNKMESFIAQYAGAVVPSNLAQMVTVAGDDAMKDTHGILERIISRTPGLSDTASPRRNMLGEVMERSKAVGEDALGAFYGTFVPIAYREVGSDIIRNELADLKHGFSAPRSTVQGVDLRAFENAKGQHAHDRWQELHGVVKVGGKSFRQALTNLIRSPKYRNLPKDLTSTEESPRVGVIRSMLGRYRAKAFEQLLDEYPELARALQEREEARARAKRGLAAL